ncbi:unnamed protein product [Didymodactylos carnosus]|uniref:adenylate cyclase n=1 Tax=Didymodactylos carnosus TaxID=1234261 RepID=A0A814KAF0_9BILA|nr:unnamed protein product [Didymodactylos carnosus]CAF1048444.1 unnamed protein product [Didymodactylos carnosus]CAF3631109.1 unnamed protein product [Didymodactylos carnosus]CAF3818149.1 unnamed protein product [Didymodactylos carnosus]
MTSLSIKRPSTMDNINLDCPQITLHKTKSIFCCQLFEQSSPFSCLYARFHDLLLEHEYHYLYLRGTQRHTYLLYIIYLILHNFLWLFYSVILEHHSYNYTWLYVLGLFFGNILSCIIAYLIYIKHYKSITFSRIHITLLSLCSLSFFLILTFSVIFNYSHSTFTHITRFVYPYTIFILIYTLSCIPLYLCLPINLTITLLCELFNYHYYQTLSELVSRLLLHTCGHIIGIYLNIILEAHNRNSFFKLRQNRDIRSYLLNEHQLISKMIDSLMPPKYAREIQTDFDYFRGRIQNISSTPSSSPLPQGQQKDEEKHALPLMTQTETNTQNDGSSSSIFRPLHIERMENVSILFADIVGFTKMSSNKTADQLVKLLSDLYGRFDDLCVRMKCEKIATLGDCYYCVCGCPEPRSDHAQCCVEMGLSMINAIEEFDQDNNENVDMRVGVHSGSVNCGIIGTIKFKFDIFSNDVTLANKMESSGKPGYVHITEATCKLLFNTYDVEQGESFHFSTDITVPTYFIKKRQLLHRITRKPPPITEATAAAVAVASGVSLNVPLNDVVSEAVAISNQEQIDNEQISLTKPLLSELTRVHVTPSIELESVSSPLNLPLESNTSVSDSTMFTLRPPRGTTISTIGGESTMSTPSHHFDETHERELLQSLKIPMSCITLSFTDSKLESDYQHSIIYHHSLTAPVNDQHHKPPLAFSNPLLNFFLDSLISFIILLLTFLYSIILILFDNIIHKMSKLWLILSLIFLFIELVGIFGIGYLCIVKYQFTRLKEKEKETFIYCSFLIRHSIATIYLLFPFVLTFLFPESCQWTTYLFVTLVTIHFGLYSMTNHLYKLTLSLATIIAYTIMCYSHTSTDGHNQHFNSTSITSEPRESTINYELYIHLLLAFILVNMISRHLEFKHRQLYYIEYKSSEQQLEIVKERERADWLLRNILPEHVIEPLRVDKGTYSKNHECVGVMFASLINFHVMYEEQYEGGKFYSRVLNEFYGDIEELLLNKKFEKIEKIKTIGATYMAASGLQDESVNSLEPVYNLLEFALQFQQTMKTFNEALLNFEFKLRIGFNYGPVTAGVIGTTKLFYDIWGDTVNVASRMDSTGQPDFIQVPEHVALTLTDRYTFQFRGEVDVKGKNKMNTYLVTGRK